MLLPLYYNPNGLLKSIGNGYSYPTRNLLFINNKTDTQSWLFKDKHFLILEYIFLPKQELNEKSKDVDAILYKLITDVTQFEKPHNLKQKIALKKVHLTRRAAKLFALFSNFLLSR